MDVKIKQGEKKIQIFTEVDDFNMGTVDYYEDTNQNGMKEKRYIPIFPHLYKTHENKSPDSKLVPLDAKCKEVFLGSSRIKKSETVELRLVDTLYLQFKTFPKN